MTEINYVAVVVAALIPMLIGSLWYSKMLFGGIWLKEMGWSDKVMEEKKKKAGKSYAGSLVASLVTAYVLAHLLNLLGASDIKMAFQAAGWLWLGLTAAPALSSALFEDRSLKSYAIHASYNLATLLAMAAILVSWV